MSEIVLLLSAEIDIQAAYEFYESCELGRGEKFLRQIDAGLDLVREYPEAAPVFGKDYRRPLVKGFPSGIFYCIEGRRLVVARVMDLRQDPNVIRRMLGGGRR